MNRVFALFALLPAFVFTACGIFGGKKDEIVIPPPPQLTQNQPKTVKREPGSLWSEDSRWNEIYTVPPARRVGDVIQLHITDSLRYRIDQSMKAKDPSLKKEPEKVAQGPMKPSDPDSADAKPEFNGGEAKPKAATGVNKNDTTDIEATILEIPSKGLYRLYANKPISLGNLSPYVVLDGNLREKDIRADDSASVEAMFNLKVDAVNLKSGTQVKNAGDEK